MEPYYQDDLCTIYCGDCIQIIPEIGLFDVVLTDPPYGITANKWDVPVDFSKWWNLIWSSCLGPVVMTAGQPFSSMAVMSQVNQFRHEWIWQKNRGSNFANTVREPMKEHEIVLVFAKSKWTYNAIRQPRNGSGADRAKYKCTFGGKSENYGDFTEKTGNELTEDRVPSSIQKFNTETGLHPTQKPIGLFSYMVRTYSNREDRVLDPFMGSGTTLLAARLDGRKSVGIDMSEKYCEIAAKRLSQKVFDFK